jgi:hypothetical protein
MTIDGRPAHPVVILLSPKSRVYTTSKVQYPAPTMQFG